MTINHFPAKIKPNMFDSFPEKCEAIKKIFLPLSTEHRYLKLIEMGKGLSPLSPSDKTPENLVRGCQSRLYLKASFKENLLFFEAEADALISAGLAALLIAVYSGETPETILTRPPLFIQELNLGSLLSPNRSSGLAHIHLRIKQEALQKIATRHIEKMV